MSPGHKKESCYVSVIVATYNGRDFLHEQLDSILQQTNDVCEILILDDGSTDGTNLLALKYANEYKHVNCLVSSINVGLVKNFEKGLSLATGEFIVLADQDDVFHPDKIKKQLNIMIQNPDLDLVISDLELIDENNQPISSSMWKFQGINSSPKFPFKYLALDNYATGCTMMFRRRLLDDALPFPSGLRIHDQWLALVAARKRGGGIGVLEEPLTKYRQHQSNVVGAKRSNKRGWNDIRRKLFSIDELKAIRHTSSQLFDEKRIRICSFLERPELFSKDELCYLKSLERLFFNFSVESKNGLLKRILCLPKAFCFSLYARSFWQTLFRFFVLTVPQKSN